MTGLVSDYSTLRNSFCDFVRVAIPKDSSILSSKFTATSILDLSTIALELSRVSKSYGDFRAVEDISFQIPTGSIYGFLGPNGAGKTTTIRMILDILRPTSGTRSILGNPSALLVRDRIGYLPEEKGLYKKMKAWSIIAYFGMLKGMKRSEARGRAFELLRRHGLGDFAESKTEALSKGMGQKVQVLASIVHDPELVILDEPFSGLDPVNQQVMEDIIKDMASRGRTILFSTHVMQHAERLCSRILLIARGRKIFDGTLAEARNTVPMRVRIETDHDIAPVLQLPEAAAVRKVDGAGHCTGTWEILMRENCDPQIILQTCFTRGIRLRSFSQSEASLHEVFVHLVGPDGGQSTFR